jgi:hypothetical protein
MNQINKMKVKWKGFSDTVLRFPLSIILLLTAVISNAVAINTQEDEIYIKLFITFAIGASVYIVLQMLYERFSQKPMIRISFTVLAILIAAGYYLLIQRTEWNVEVTIRTTVIFFLLLIAFLWVPVIKSKNNFNESFMAAFKAFFISLLFTVVLFLGVCLVLGATNMLITDIAGEAYMHAANIIFVLLAPIYFLSLIPVYPGNKELEVPMLTTETELSEEEPTNREEIRIKLITPTRFLETLISYIIIPITAVFTVILILYIVINITGSFWTDNLLEPLLVSYSITVIIVYLLASTLSNAFARYFRWIFPKVLVLVVLFQTISSILRIGDLGITYGRYYVILFGVFATIAGILFYVIPSHKNGIIAPVLITLAFLSILPPVDAFTISKTNQISRLEKALIRNNMLEEDTIKANPNVSEKDREVIITSFRYLDRMDYTKDVTWLTSYHRSLNFKSVFGFSDYDQIDKNYLNIYLKREGDSSIPITGYDYLLRMNYYNQTATITGSVIEQEGKSYTIYVSNTSEDDPVLILEEKNRQELIRFNMNEIFNRYTNSSLNNTEVSTEEFTFEKDNDAATLKLIVESININEWENGKDQQADIYILVKIK